MASKWWVAGATLLIALSGCAEPSGGLNQWEYTPPEEREPQETLASEPAPNTAPEAILAASVLNGTAPLNVTLTLEGSDADGDNLTWELTVGNETETGDALPATVNRTLEAGNHTFTLVVRDGELAGNATLVIAVAEAVEVVEEVSDGMCHRDTANQGDLYVHDEGGTWVFMESNDVPGLQVGNSHPGGPEAGTAGFEKAEWADCQNPDLMLI